MQEKDITQKMELSKKYPGAVKRRRPLKAVCQRLQYQCFWNRLPRWRKAKTVQKWL